MLRQKQSIGPTQQTSSHLSRQSLLWVDIVYLKTARYTMLHSQEARNSIQAGLKSHIMLIEKLCKFSTQNYKTYMFSGHPKSCTRKANLNNLNKEFSSNVSHLHLGKRRLRGEACRVTAGEVQYQHHLHLHQHLNQQKQTKEVAGGELLHQWPHICTAITSAHITSALCLRNT